jgi:GMP synthase PP-ATPase subunit
MIKLSHGGARAGSGRKAKHVDGSVQSARISRMHANQLAALAKLEGISKSDMLEQIIQAEYKRVFGETVKRDGVYLPVGG